MKIFTDLPVGKVKGKPNFKLSMLEYASNVNDILLDFTFNKMIGWHHGLNGHDFEQTLGDSKGLGSLACCSPWVTKSLTRLSN